MDFEALKNSRDYDQQLHLKLRVLKTFESLIQTFYNKKMQKDDRFLDLGSSDGALVEVAKQRGYKAVGLDIDSCNFEKLAHKEKAEGFIEGITPKNKKKKTKFFLFRKRK